MVSPAVLVVFVSVQKRNQTRAGKFWEAKKEKEIVKQEEGRLYLLGVRNHTH